MCAAKARLGPAGRKARRVHSTRALDAISRSATLGATVSRPDLNLLVTLDVVLTEGSVARAAQRLGLRPAAMSRGLARLRA